MTTSKFDEIPSGVAHEMQEKKEMSLDWDAITKAFVVLFGIIFLMQGIHIVNYGERGVLTVWGKVDMDERPEGIYFKIPYAQAYYNMDVKVQKMEGDADSASQDLQSLDTTVALNYHIDSERAAEIFQKIGRQEIIESTVIEPAIQEACKAGTAQFTAEELITKRPLVKDAIKILLTERLGNYGIILDDFSIVNFQFSKEFDDAIELKVTAEQNSLKAKWELEQYRTEQQKVVAEAEAYATAIMTKAGADANSTLIRAGAEADAFKLKNAQLTPLLVEYLKLMQWDGNLPYFMGGGAVPFINVNGSG